MGTRVRKRRGARKGSKSNGDDRNSVLGRWASAAFPNFKGAVFGKAVASDLPKDAFVFEDDTFDADLGQKKGADALVGSYTWLQLQALFGMKCQCGVSVYARRLLKLVTNDLNAVVATRLGSKVLGHLVDKRGVGAS